MYRSGDPKKETGHVIASETSSRFAGPVACIIDTFPQIIAVPTYFHLTKHLLSYLTKKYQLLNSPTAVNTITDLEPKFG